MATVPQVKTEGDIWAGLATSGTIPERYRKSDNLGKLAFLERGEAKFMQIVSSHFPQSKQVDDREFRVQEISELDRTFKITIGSVGTGHNTFGLTNRQAAQLTNEDILVLSNTFTKVITSNLYAGQVGLVNNIPVVPNIPYTPPHLNFDTGGLPINILFSRQPGISQAGDVFTTCEIVQITRIGAADSAAVGSTLITVDRCFHGPHARDKGGAMIPKGLINTCIAADTVNSPIQVGDQVLRALPSFWEGTGMPTGFYKNPTIDINFTQEFKYALEKTNESDIVNNNLPKTPMEINKWLVNKRMALDIERTWLFGRKGKAMDSQGKVKYMTGGVIEWIPQDKEHWITYKQPTINYKGIIDTTREVSLLGGSTEKFAFVGPGLYGEFKKAFYDDGHFEYDQDLTAKFDIPIESMIGAGVKLNIIPLYSMYEAGWDYRMLILDFGYPSFMPVTNKGWDMVYRKDIAEKGVEIYKEGFIGMKGLERRYADYHCIIDFPIF